jgi:hypothetical protein
VESRERKIVDEVREVDLRAHVQEKEQCRVSTENGWQGLKEGKAGLEGKKGGRDGLPGRSSRTRSGGSRQSSEVEEGSFREKGRKTKGEINT